MLNILVEDWNISLRNERRSRELCIPMKEWAIEYIPRSAKMVSCLFNAIVLEFISLDFIV